jgi:hypothetical protein
MQNATIFITKVLSGYISSQQNIIKIFFQVKETSVFIDKKNYLMGNFYE